MEDRPDRIDGDGRIARRNLRGRQSRGQVVEDDGDHDPGARDTGLPMTDIRELAGQVAACVDYDTAASARAPRTTYTRCLPER